jgi:hypothetical protein
MADQPNQTAIAAASAAGRAAQARGDAVTTCPYPVRGRDLPAADMLGVVWVRGYTAAELAAAGWTS